MTFTFDEEIAKKYGVNEAIFIQNIFFWQRTNEANEKHFYDGRYWTYNSIKAFTEIFSFWSIKTIRNIIDKLEKLGVLVSGNYSKSTYNRTKWYSLQNGVIHLSETANGIVEKGKSITDNKPYVNSLKKDISNDISKESPESSISNDTPRVPKKEWGKTATDSAVNEYIDQRIQSPKVKEAFMDFIGMRAAMGKKQKVNTMRTLELLVDTLYKHATTEDEAVMVINKSIARNYIDLFPLRDDERPQKTHSVFDGKKYM